MNSTDTRTTTNVTRIANPFVSKELIDEKKVMFSYALDKIEHPVGITLNVGDSRQVKCVFGNVLDDFWCDIPTFAAKWTMNRPKFFIIGLTIIFFNYSELSTFR